MISNVEQAISFLAKEGVIKTPITTVGAITSVRALKLPTDAQASLIATLTGQPFLIDPDSKRARISVGHELMQIVIGLSKASDLASPFTYSTILKEAAESSLILTEIRMMDENNVLDVPNPELSGEVAVTVTAKPERVRKAREPKAAKPAAEPKLNKDGTAKRKRTSRAPMYQAYKDLLAAGVTERNDIVAKFMDTFGFSKITAQTYYYDCVVVAKRGELDARIAKG